MSSISTRGRWFLGMAIGGAIAFNANYANAQIIPDGTLPTNSSVIQEAQTYNITGGTQAGSNLFHSFGEFSVPTNFTASFNNATNIQNIISRVTGSSVSNIDGLIRANGTANLFLINPNGIIFGPNASLNIGGSFVATTASAIGFGNQGFFSATNPNTPELLTINPSAFFFNQMAAARIQTNSIAPAETAPTGSPTFGLRVPDGKSLLLVGGNVSLDGGGLNAFGGRVELGGLVSPGTVGLLLDGNNLSLGFPSNVTRADVSLTNGARVLVAGAGGGSIAVNARNLEISGGSTLRAGIDEGLGSVGAIAGDIKLNATGEIKVVASDVLNNVQRGAVGDGGNITINSGSFSLQDSARLQASIFGQGKAGNVTVGAQDAVSLVDARIFSTVEAGGVGFGGDININAATLSLIDGAQLQTLTHGASNTLPARRGDAGNVNVNVRNAVSITGVKNGLPSAIFSSVGTGTVGNGGNITIDSGSFELLNGAQLSASTSGQGKAGNVTVHAKEAVFLTGAIFSTVEAGGVGKGGDININGATLSLINGAQLLTVTLGASATQPAGRGDAGNVNVNVTGAVNINGFPSGIFSSVGTGTVGNGGNITINSGSFELSDGALLSALTSGQGNAGNVNVNVRSAVNIAGAVSIAGESFPTAILSFVDTGTVGNGGNITIDSGSFELKDGAVISASTLGQGKAGNVTVRAKEAVSLANSAGILSTVEASGVGKGGNIDINGATLSLLNGAQLVTATRSASATQSVGWGDAGNVNVNVRSVVNIAGRNSAILSFVQTGTVGNGGNITIDSGSFELKDGAQLSASTLGQGNAGSVTVRAKEAVFLAGASILSTVEAGGFGKGGDININGATLSLIDGAQLVTATRSASATQPAGRGDAGNVNVNVSGAISIAGAVSIAGVKNPLRSGIFSSVETGTIGNGGNITIDSGSFELLDGALLSASTLGQGNAGKVTVRAKEAVSLADASILSTVEAGGFGKGGDIDINGATLSLIDGAQLATITRRASANQPAGRGDAGNVNVNVRSAVSLAGEKNGLASAILSFVETGTVGDGGNITINSGSFELLDGAVVEASTSGQGNAGTIKVNAANFVNISGKSSNFNSGLFVNSQSTTGTAGDIIVTSPRVTLDNSGTLSAESASGNGGNINLQTDLLLLRRGAQISTNAGTQEAGGDGGNITIIAPNGFIIAVPNENSDITANAFEGKGGRVQINAFGIYGIGFRDTENPLTSDITASSTFGADGTVELNTPEIDPNSGLINLPTVPVDTALAQGCYTPGYAQSSFIITGRGGLPPNPKEVLSPDAVEVDWVTLDPEVEKSSSTSISVIPTNTTPAPIVEATGWVYGSKGEVIFTAEAVPAQHQNSWQTATKCHEK